MQAHGPDNRCEGGKKEPLGEDVSSLCGRDPYSASELRAFSCGLHGTDGAVRVLFAMKELGILSSEDRIPNENLVDFYFSCHLAVEMDQYARERVCILRSCVLRHFVENGRGARALRSISEELPALQGKDFWVFPLLRKWQWSIFLYCGRCNTVFVLDASGKLHDIT